MKKNNQKRLLERVISHQIDLKEFNKAESYLLNYNFIRNKTILIGVGELIKDYVNLLKHNVLNVQKKEALELLADSFKQMRYIVERHPKELGFQLMGYLPRKKNKYLKEIIRAINIKSSKGDIKPQFPSFSLNDKQLIERVDLKAEEITSSKVDYQNGVILLGTSKGSLEVFYANSEKKESLQNKQYKDEIIKIEVIDKDNVITLTKSEEFRYSLTLWDLKTKKIINEVKSKIKVYSFIEQITIIEQKSICITQSFKKENELIIRDARTLKILEKVKFGISISSFISLKSNLNIQKGKEATFKDYLIVNYITKKDRVILGVYCIRAKGIRKKTKYNLTGYKAFLKIEVDNFFFAFLINKEEVLKIHLPSGSFFGSYRLDSKNQKEFENGREEEFEDFLLDFKNINENTCFLVFEESIRIVNIEKGICEEVISFEDRILTSKVNDHYRKVLLRTERGRVIIYNLKNMTIEYDSKNWSDIRYIELVGDNHIMHFQWEALFVWKLVESRGNNSHGINHFDEITSLKMRGKILYSSSKDGNIHIYNTAKNKVIRKFKSAAPINDMDIVKYSYYDEIIVAGLEDTIDNQGGLACWKIDRLHKNAKQKGDHIHNNFSVKKVISLQQGQVIYMSNDCAVHLLNLITSQSNSFDYQPHIKEFESLYDRNSRVIKNIKDGKEQVELSFDQTILYNYVSQVFDAKSKLIVGYYDGMIKLWDLVHGYLLHEFYGHEECIKAIDISANGQYLLSSDLGNHIKLWSLKTFEVLACFKGEKGLFLKIYSKKNSNDSKVSFMILNNSKFEVFQCPNFQQSVKVIEEKISSILLYKRFKVLLTLNKENGEVTLWNTIDWTKISSAIIGRPLTRVILSEKEDKIIIGEKNGQIHFFEMTPENHLKRI